MAIPGQGYRFAADVLAEVSLHLIEPICYCELIAVTGGGGWGVGGWGVYGWGQGPPNLLQISSLNALYVGAQIIVGWGLSTAEVVTIISIATSGGKFYVATTALVNSHDPGEVVFAPTFPYQQPTDAAFTQQEMLGYLSRAQNEYLSDCGCFYQLAMQTLTYGQIIQSTPSNCIEINRVAASQFYSAVSSFTRAGNVVTCDTLAPHGLQVGSTFYAQSTTAGFSGVFEVATVPSKTSLTYPQLAANGSASGGALLYFSRIYETTSTEITFTDRTWKNDYVPVPTAWYEDRVGLYKWGINGKASSNYPCELLMSIRDTDTLGLLDGFLVSDVLVPILKYKVLAYAFTKDGIQQDPARAAFCEQKYQRGVLSTLRYLNGFQLGLKAGA